MFEELFLSHFRDKVKLYCESKNISFKTSLLLDNVPGHPKNLNDVRSEIKVIYLLLNTTSLLQPLDLDIMSTVRLKFLDLTVQATSGWSSTGVTSSPAILYARFTKLGKTLVRPLSH